MRLIKIDPVVIAFLIMFTAQMGHSADEKTEASSFTSSPQAATASWPTASDTFTTAPARRRSADGNAIGKGSTQRAGS